MMHNLTQKGLPWTLSSDQGHGLTWKYHVAHQSIRQKTVTLKRRRATPLLLENLFSQPFRNFCEKFSPTSFKMIRPPGKVKWHHVPKHLTRALERVWKLPGPNLTKWRNYGFTLFTPKFLARNLIKVREMESTPFYSRRDKSQWRTFISRLFGREQLYTPQNKENNQLFAAAFHAKIFGVLPRTHSGRYDKTW